MWRERSGYRYLFNSGAGDEPALVLLHGTGDDAGAFLELGRHLAPRSTLLSVQGDVDENGMARFFKRTAMGVYDRADLKARTDAFRAFLTDAMAAHGLGATTIGLGYSNGANLLANLLFEHPGTLRRAVLLHPLIPFEPPAADLRGTEVLVTSGQRDPIAPAEATDRLVEVLRTRGTTVHHTAHGGGHEIGAAEVQAVRTFLGSG